MQIKKKYLYCYLQRHMKLNLIGKGKNYLTFRKKLSRSQETHNIPPPPQKKNKAYFCIIIFKKI